jgi:hypothetical protein
MNKKIIKSYLSKTFIKEENTPGISVTDKAKKESEKINKAGLKAYSKEVKAKEDKDTNKMAQNKFVYDDKFQKTYHEEMEIMNGQEMIQYDSKLDSNFTGRAKEGLEGSSRMGNEGGIGNAEAAFGASSDNFGKDLVKRIKSSEKKRNEQTPTLNLRGRDIQADMKDTGHKPYAIEENIQNTVKEIAAPKKPLSEKGITTLTSWVTNLGAKEAAVKLINQLSQTGMVSDFPDTVEYGSGLNRVISLLEKADYNNAYHTAKALAIKLEKKAMRDMMGENEEETKDFNDGEDYEKVSREVEYGINPNKDNKKSNIKESMMLNKNNLEVKKAANEEISKSVTTGSGWDEKTKNVQQGNLTLNSYAKQLYSLFKKEGAKVKLLSTQGGIGEKSGENVYITSINNTLQIIIANVGDPMAMANKYGPMILKQFPDLIVKEKPKLQGWSGMETATFTLAPKQTNKGGTNVTETNSPNELENNNNDNEPNIKESMKRLKFKTNFNGLGNALRLIPEGYRVDKKEFEMTDGNETYRIRWEGNLKEGNAVVLTANDKTLVNEDIQRMKALFGYKSQDTLGVVKGNARIDENKIFGDIWNKSKVLLGESEDMEGVNATEGNWGDKTKKAPEATKHVEGSTSKDKGTQAPKAKEGNPDDAKSQAAEAKKHVSTKKASMPTTAKPKESNWDDVTGGEKMFDGQTSNPKEGYWEDNLPSQSADAKKHVHLKESEGLWEAFDEEDETEEAPEKADNWNKPEDDDSSSEVEPSMGDMGGEEPSIDSDTEDDAISVPTPSVKGGAQLLFSPSTGKYWIKGAGLPMAGMEVPSQFLEIASDKSKKSSVKASIILKKIEDMEMEPSMGDEEGLDEYGDEHAVSTKDAVNKMKEEEIDEYGDEHAVSTKDAVNKIK